MAFNIYFGVRAQKYMCSAARSEPFEVRNPVGNRRKTAHSNIGRSKMVVL